MMRLETLQSISLAVAQERDLDLVLRKIVEGLVGDLGIALARIWLIGPGDRCANCRSQEHCQDRNACLRLMASAGKSIHSPDENWSRLNGEFARIPLGGGKIGGVASSGEPVLISDVSLDWTTSKTFSEREQIKSFAAQPLVFRGDILGVLAIFSRAYLQEENFLWLRTFADHAAVAIGNSRTFEENSRLRERLEPENAYLREEVQYKVSNATIVGRSYALKHVLKQIALVAYTEASVLIQGESGTGKELVAQAIHNQSRRREQPLVRVNCASIPRELFESEFFGHAKGSFTGASRDRPGRFHLAEGGTLFLDEVGEIPTELQGKLLRVLQDGEYERVGEDVTRQMNVRVIAATNRDLSSEVKKGTFRQDLYYRLCVFPIEVPPLRLRKEDLPELATHLLQAACLRLEVPEIALEEDHLEILRQHDWPGNVRELRNVIERAVIMRGKGRLKFEDLTLRTGVEDVSTVSPPAPPREVFFTEQHWTQMERENLQQILRLANGKVGGPGGAAELLGVHPTTLRSRLKSKGITGR